MQLYKRICGYTIDSTELSDYCATAYTDNSKCHNCVSNCAPMYHIFQVGKAIKNDVMTTVYPAPIQCTWLLCDVMMLRVNFLVWCEYMYSVGNNHCLQIIETHMNLIHVHERIWIWKQIRHNCSWKTIIFGITMGMCLQFYLIPDAVKGRYCTSRYSWNIIPVRNYFLFSADLPYTDLFSIVGILLCGYYVIGHC